VIDDVSTGDVVGIGMNIVFKMIYGRNFIGRDGMHIHYPPNYDAMVLRTCFSCTILSIEYNIYQKENLLQRYYAEINFSPFMTYSSVGLHDTESDSLGQEPSRRMRLVVRR
jgi:hypothetical protein